MAIICALEFSRFSTPNLTSFSAFFCSSLPLTFVPSKCSTWKQYGIVLQAMMGQTNRKMNTDYLSEFMWVQRFFHFGPKLQQFILCEIECKNAKLNSKKVKFI